MKVHIAKRNDTFESIAQQYGVSLQDLIGMNTHINYLAGLVPGLKIKLPDINRKDGLSFQEKVQTHFPKVDTGAVDLHSGSTDQIEDVQIPEPVQQQTSPAVVQEVPVEESVQVPLKQVADAGIADGIKVDIPQPHISQGGPSTTFQAGSPASDFGFTQDQAQSFADWPQPAVQETVAGSGNSGVTVNQTPYQHPHLATEQAPTQTYQHSTYLGEAPLGQSYAFGGYQQPPMVPQVSYYDRPPGSNAYSTYIPGPATIIYHSFDPRGWDYRQPEPLPVPEYPIIYPGGYGYPTRGADVPCCAGTLNTANYLSFYYPDEASYWAAFPWNL